MQSPLIIMMETQATTPCCLEPFRWESLRGWDFRPQLIVVSGLLGGNPFVDGILGHNLLLSQAFSVGIPSWMGFRLSRSPLFFTNSSSFHNRILAIRRPFLTNFSFSRWKSGYQGAFLTNFSFSRWKSGYQGAFHTNLFFFHDGILAIKEPFTRTFSFFTMEFWLSRSLSHELFLFHDGILEIRNLGEDCFHIYTYIYIYHKEYLHRIRLVKNLAS
jgi:hypothetical protein